MNKPKVSILVPVYNVEKYLHRCIDSILLQTFTDFECILVNDCSPDNCPKICDEYAEKDNRIKVIHKSQNEGLPFARKTGFENSCGDYIQFIDSDDRIEPDMTEKLYTAALKTDADITVCDFYEYNIHGYKYCTQNYDTEDNFNNLGFVHRCSVWNKLFRKKTLASVEFPRAGKYEDRVITQQAFFFAKKITKIPYPLYHYYINPESSFRKFNIKIYYEWQENILFVIDFLQKNLKDQFEKKRKNINKYVNNFKLNVLKNKILRREKALFMFYQESKFWRWFFVLLLKKTVKAISPYIFLWVYKKMQNTYKERKNKFL